MWPGSSSCSQASGNGNGQIQLWTASDFVSGPTVETGSKPVNCIAWSNESQQFAVGTPGSNQIQVLMTDGTVNRVLEGAPIAGTNSVAWSSDGGQLISTGTHIKLHDFADDSKSVEFPPGSARSFGSCWHPDGQRFATVDEHRNLRIWRPNGALLKETRGHGWANTSQQIGWSHDGEFLASTGQVVRQIQLWTRRGELQEIPDGSYPIAWHPRDRQLTMRGAKGTNLQLQSLDGSLIETVVTTQERSAWVAWNPDGSQLARRLANGTSEIWQSGGRRLATLEGHVNPGIDHCTVAWSPDGTALATAGDDKTVRLWQSDATPEAVLQQPGVCHSVAWHPDSNRIAAATDLTTVIWKRDGSRELALNLRYCPDFSVDWSPAGNQLVTGSHDNSVRIWSDDGTQQAVLQEHDCAVRSVDWNPTGTLIASQATDNTIIVWDATTTEAVWVGVQLGTGDSVSFTAAGQVIHGTSDVIEEHFVYIVENEDGQQELLKPSEFQQRIKQAE